VELSSSSTTQSGHHLRTVQTTAEGTPFSGSMNTMALCDFDMRRLRRTVTYLLTYLPVRQDFEVSVVRGAACSNVVRVINCRSWVVDAFLKTMGSLVTNGVSMTEART